MALSNENNVFVVLFVSETTWELSLYFWLQKWLKIVEQTQSVWRLLAVRASLCEGPWCSTNNNGRQTGSFLQTTESGSCCQDTQNGTWLSGLLSLCVCVICHWFLFAFVYFPFICNICEVQSHKGGLICFGLQPYFGARTYLLLTTIRWCFSTSHCFNTTYFLPLIL